MRRGVRVGVLLLVVLAGCSGVPGADPRPVVSVTPAEVPDDPTPSGAEVLDVGPEGSRFTDPSAMAAAHRAVLANTSYTVISTQTIRFPADGREGQWRLTGRFEADGPFLIETVRNGSVFGRGAPVRIDFWSDGRLVVEAFRADGSTTVNIVRDAQGNPVPPRAVVPGDPRFEGELARVLGSTSIQSLSRVGTTEQSYARVRVTATGPVDAAQPPSLDVATTVTKLTARLVIDERGLVHEYRLRYQGSFAGQPVVVTRSVRYAALGTTTVEQPPWAAAALNATPTPGYGTSSGSNASS